MMPPSPPIHIEHLFATSLTVDRPPADAIGLDGLTSSVGDLEPGASRPLWNDAPGATRAGAAAALIAYIRRLATAVTADTRGARAPSWHAEATLHSLAGGVPSELPVRFDAFWTGLFVVDDGYRTADDAGGELALTDPRLPAPMMEAPGLRLVLAEAPQPVAYVPELLVRPATGQLFLYPAWLRVQHRPRAPGHPRHVIQVSLVAPAE